MFFYRQILGQAWKITWQKKYLWFFGIFASILSLGAEYQILSSATSREKLLKWLLSFDQIWVQGVLGGGFFTGFYQLFKYNALTGLAVLLIFLGTMIIGFFLLWLAVSSQITLIADTDKVIKGQEDNLNWRSSLKSSQPYFWTSLGLNIISKAVVSLLVLIVGLPIIFIFGSQALSLGIYLILFIILIPTAISFSLLIKYALAYVTLKKEDFGSALRSGFSLFKKNWLISLEMAIILFVISFLATIAVFIACAVLAIPFIILATSFFQLFSFAAFWGVFIIGIIVLALFVVLAGSLITVFQISAWTGLFLRLIGPGGMSKLERLLPRLRNKDVRWSTAKK